MAVAQNLRGSLNRCIRRACGRVTSHQNVDEAGCQTVRANPVAAGSVEEFRNNVVLIDQLPHQFRGQEDQNRGCMRTGFWWLLYHLSEVRVRRRNS